MFEDKCRYNKHNVLTFGKTTGQFGGFSNMSPNYVMFVNEICVPNTEALYQACKFSLYPDIQKQILEETNPVIAKRISREHQDFVRQDWEHIQCVVMEWCLRIKLLQNWNTFGALLRDSGTSTIVEYSTKDDIWGAVPISQDYLEGRNMMGRLLMKLRNEFVLQNKRPTMMTPPTITGLLLYGYPIGTVYSPEYYLEDL